LASNRSLCNVVETEGKVKSGFVSSGKAAFTFAREKKRFVGHRANHGLKKEEICSSAPMIRPLTSSEKKRKNWGGGFNQRLTKPREKKRKGRSVIHPTAGKHYEKAGEKDVGAVQKKRSRRMERLKGEKIARSDGLICSQWRGEEGGKKRRQVMFDVPVILLKKKKKAERRYPRLPIAGKGKKRKSNWKESHL